MADSDDKKRPAPPGTPGAPLQRLWKLPPEDDEDEDARPKKASKAKDDAGKKKAEGKGTGGPKSKKSKDKDVGKGDKAGKGVLVEETPEFDTYETRQRVRIAVGIGFLGVCLIAGFLVYRAFSPKNPADQNGPEGGVVGTPAPNPRERDEREAKILFERARQVAKNGKADDALAILKRVRDKYPATQTANEAKAALERPAQHLPLFLEGKPAVVAKPTGSAAPEPAPPPPKQVVHATPTAVGPASNASASLTLPANPAEGATRAATAAGPRRRAPAPRARRPGPPPRPGPRPRPRRWSACEPSRPASTRPRTRRCTRRTGRSRSSATATGRP